MSLFLAPLIFNLLFALVVYFVLHRRPGLRAEADDELAVSTESSASESEPGTTRLTISQVPTLIGLTAMALSVLIFGWDVGFVTTTIVIVLTFINPAAGKAAMARVSWSVVILITGVLTDVAVLQAASTVEWASEGISAIGIPLLAALLLFYISGLISALASSDLDWPGPSQRCRPC